MGCVRVSVATARAVLVDLVVGRGGCGACSGDCGWGKCRRVYACVFVVVAILLWWRRRGPRVAVSRGCILLLAIEGLSRMLCTMQAAAAAQGSLAAGFGATSFSFVGVTSNTNSPGEHQLRASASTVCHCSSCDGSVASWAGCTSSCSLCNTDGAAGCLLCPASSGTELLGFAPAPCVGTLPCHASVVAIAGAVAAAIVVCVRAVK